MFYIQDTAGMTTYRYRTGHVEVQLPLHCEHPSDLSDKGRLPGPLVHPSDLPDKGRLPGPLVHLQYHLQPVPDVAVVLRLERWRKILGQPEVEVVVNLARWKYIWKQAKEQ